MNPPWLLRSVTPSSSTSSAGSTGSLAPLVRPARPPAGPARRPSATRGGPTRCPRVAAGVAAAPRFVGKLADLLPLQNTVGTAVQSIVVLGVAGEHGVDGPAPSGCPCWPASCSTATCPPTRSSRCSSAGQGHLPRGGVRRPRAAGGRAAPSRTLWRVARLLGRIDDALDARPKGKLRHRALSNLPVVGVLGGYAAEREGAAPGGRAGRRGPRAAALSEVSGVSGSAARQVRRTPHASPSTGSW